MASLWPESSAEEHSHEALPILDGTAPGTLPVVIFVAEFDSEIAGFIEVGLRSHADGCDNLHPVGFLEGWFVVDEYRKQGVGAALLAAAENWARAQGCVEMASDTWIDSEQSQRVHESLKFEVVDRCVHYRKAL
jgi:aminoglycoside 6'-N-acetyltransferase I